MLVYFQYWYCFMRKIVKITYALRWVISVEVHKVCAIFWSPHWPSSTFHSSVPGLIQNSCLHQIQEFQSSEIEEISIVHNFESQFQVSINCLIQVNLFQRHLFLHQLTHKLLSYCGLIDAKIRASDKDLPLQFIHSEKASKFEKITYFRFVRLKFLIRFKIGPGRYVLVNLATFSVIIVH